MTEPKMHVSFTYRLGGELRTVPADGRCAVCGNTHTPDLRFFGETLACRNAGTCRVAYADTMYPSEILTALRTATFA
jgi:hypothetical protein